MRTLVPESWKPKPDSLMAIWIDAEAVEIFYMSAVTMADLPLPTLRSFLKECRSCGVAMGVTAGLPSVERRSTKGPGIEAWLAANVYAASVAFDRSTIDRGVIKHAGAVSRTALTLPARQAVCG